MKKFFSLLSLILLASSCSGQSAEIDPNNLPGIPDYSYDYDDVLDKHIYWNDIFDQENNNYFVYFYSTNCNHCQTIKDQMISLCLSRNDLYFVKSSNQVVLKNDVFYTIGAGNIGDFAILGYPSLVQIQNKICVKNIAGKSQILNSLSN